MANQCPKCGKETRTAAKFCGFCGADLKQTPPVVVPSPAARIEADSIKCPKCGKPVRPGVKFCTSCGQSIPASTPASAATIQEPPVASPPRPQKSSAAPEASQGPALAAPIAGRSQTPPAQSQIPTKRNLSKWLYVLLTVILLIICIVSLFLAARAGGLIGGKPTPTPTVLEEVTIDTETAVPETQLPTLTETEELSTETPLPTATQTPEEATQEPTAAVPTETTQPIPTDTTEPMATATLEPTTEPVVIFEDNFEGNLEDQWIFLPGEPLPGIDPNFKFLELNGINDPTVGIRVIEPIVLKSSLSIAFDATIGVTSDTHTLYFNWTSDVDEYPPDELGMIYIEIGNGKMTIEDQRESRQLCFGGVEHTARTSYRIEFSADSKLNLYIDQELVNWCTDAEMRPLTNLSGYLTISGFGAVDQIAVFGAKE